MFVSRDKYIADYKAYDSHFDECKAEGVSIMKQAILQQKKAANKAQAEAAEKDAPSKIAESMPGLAIAQGLVGDKADDEMDGLDDNVELSFAQEEQIKKDVIKKLKKERVIEGGIKLVREKSAF